MTGKFSLANSADRAVNRSLAKTLFCNSNMAYLFDLDGVILDSMNTWKNIDILFLKKRGISLPADYMDAVATKSFSEAADYTIQRFNLPDSSEKLLKEWDDMATYAYANTVPLKPNIKQILGRLHHQGATLAVSTSLPARLYQPALMNHGINHFFSVVCGKEEAGCGKSLPDIFRTTAEKLGVPPSECMVFDDILPAVKNAKSIGMKVCGVYDKANQSDWNQIQQTADFTIKKWKELL